MLDKIYELRDEIDSLENKVESLESDVLDITSELKYLDNSKEETINDAYEAAKDEYEDEVNAKYEPDIDKLEDVIDEILEQLNKLTLSEEDETEEVKEARIALDNRNQSAILLAKMQSELTKATSRYFVDNAYTDEGFTDEEFVTNLETIPKRIKAIKKLRESVDEPIASINEYIGQDKSVTSAYYFFLFTRWPSLIKNTIGLVRQSVSRAKYLNEQSNFYHSMMHALVALKDKHDSEINAMLNGLLQQKRANLEQALEQKREALNKIKEEHKAELEKFSFDDTEIRNQILAERKELAERLDNTNKQLAEAKKLIKDKEDELDLLTEKHEDILMNTVNSYLMPREVEDREVVIPDKLLFSKSDESLTYFRYETGLYIYQDLTNVQDFISLVTFQLRNVMEWGSIQFRVIDSLGGQFMIPFALPEQGNTKTQDVFVYVLNKEIDEITEQTYNTYERRKNQSLKTIRDIGTFNTLQKERNSSVQAYQFLYIVLTGAVKLNEKLIQLIKNGTSMGVIVHIYVKQEQIKLEMVKDIEDIFTNFVELSESGMTYYEPAEVREQLEQEELEKKTRI